MSNNLKEFEKTIGYTFSDVDKLKLALTHSSYGNEVYRDKLHNNERLEFLGDAVLEVTVSDFLFKKYGDVPEGELTKLRASIVCEPTLAICAREIGLGNMIYLGKGEEQTGGRFRDSITSDAMEAVIGAIYLDGGIECAGDFIRNHILNDIDRKKLFVDSKSILQERIQALGITEMKYIVVSESGPDHMKEFGVDLYVEGKVIGHGSGRTKKAAEQHAAYDAITRM